MSGQRSIIDIRGQKFDKLTVLERISQKGAKGDTIWKCQCECGNVIEARSWHLRHGYTKMCHECAAELAKNPRNDLYGKRFGKLVAFKYLSNSDWICKCDCGREYTAKSYNLVRGHTTQCDHCQQSRSIVKPKKSATNKERPLKVTKMRGHRKRIDRTGKKIGKLTAIEFVGMRKGQSCYRFRCECGNEFEATWPAMAQRKEAQCAECQQKATIHYGRASKYIGKRYGSLVVVARVKNKSQWLCKCDCGNYVIISSHRISHNIFRHTNCMDISAHPEIKDW